MYFPRRRKLFFYKFKYSGLSILKKQTYILYFHYLGFTNFMQIQFQKINFPTPNLGLAHFLSSCTHYSYAERYAGATFQKFNLNPKGSRKSYRLYQDKMKFYENALHLYIRDHYNDNYTRTKQ